MKKLTVDQRSEVGAHNLWSFLQLGTIKRRWFLSFIPYSRQTMGSAGWWLTNNVKHEGMYSGVRVDAWPHKGKDHPDTFREKLEPKLIEIGCTWPEEWIKYDGAWMDKAIYEKRMAELVAQWKELQKEIK